MPGGDPLDDQSLGGSTTPDAGGSGAVGGAASSGPAGGSAAAGLRAQIGATRAALGRLLASHINLARAEFGEIMAEVKRLATGFGIAFAVLLFAGLLLSVGGPLFVGEWLFGSMGWGLLHGLELCIAIAVVAILGVLAATRSQVIRTFVLALILGIVVGIAFGLDLANQGWSRLGDSSFPGLEPGIRPLLVAEGVSAAVLAVLGLLLGARSGGVGGAFGGAFIGAILGAVLGSFTAISWGPRPGAAAGVAVGLAAWPAALGWSVYRHGVDLEALKARLYPQQTIETTRETIEWVRKQTPLGRKS